MRKTVKMRVGLYLVKMYVAIIKEGASKLSYGLLRKPVSNLNLGLVSELPLKLYRERKWSEPCLPASKPSLMGSVE